MTTDNELTELRAKHIPVTRQWVIGGDTVVCFWDKDLWPCDTIRALDAVNNLRGSVQFATEGADRLMAQLDAAEVKCWDQATRIAELEAVVKEAARMGLCSQTHHESLMVAARAALAPKENR